MLRAHPNVPTCYACYETGRYYVLVLDPCTAGELSPNAARRVLVAEAHSAIIMQQVLSVLAACHDVGIAHRCAISLARQLCGCVFASCLPLALLYSNVRKADRTQAGLHHSWSCARNLCNRAPRHRHHADNGLVSLFVSRVRLCAQDA